MGVVRKKLMNFLEKSVHLLRNSPHYEWGHSGSCNCGHLAQAITEQSPAQIHRWSQEKAGDWSEKAKAYCQSSGYKIDAVISTMLSQGLRLEDIQHIEYLSHPEVVSQLPAGKRSLRRNNKEDVILYFETWIQVLQQQASGSLWTSQKMAHRDEVEIYDSVPEVV